MFDVETRRKTRARPVSAIYLKKKIPCQGARKHADCESGDTDNRGKQNAAEYDSDVVNQRRQRRYDELPFRVLHRAQNASLVETNLSGQHQARKKNNASSFGRAESRSDPIHDVRSKNLAYQNESNQNKTHHRDHGGRSSPALSIPLLRCAVRKDRKAR